MIKNAKTEHGQTTYTDRLPVGEHPGISSVLAKKIVSLKNL